MNWITRLRSLCMTRLAPSEQSDVIVIDDPWPEIVAARRNAIFGLTMPARKPWNLWGSGAVLTIAVHFLFFGTLALGTKGHTARPPLDEGFSASGINTNAKETVSILFFVNDASIHIPEEGNDSPYALPESEITPTTKSNLIASAANGASTEPPSLEDFDPSAERTQETTGDGAEAAKLFGVYMGQIKARIERAWNYETQPSSKSGQCRVQIRQSPNGDVQDIIFQRCDLDVETQMSLVRAIEAASPLSAPPREKLFTEVVTLSFTTSARITHSTDSNHDLAAQRSVRVN
jgi:hypothetical protein